MRFIILAAAAAVPVALANWNGEICSGAGGCLGNSAFIDDPWRCPDGSSLTVSGYANDWGKAGAEGAPTATKAEFPKTCYNGRYPGANDKLIRTTTRNNQVIYSWITENCTNKNPQPRGDCYSHNPNPSTYSFCKMVDSNGGQCNPNPKAGRCERWGYDINMYPECKGFKIGDEDIPENSQGL